MSREKRNLSLQKIFQAIPIITGLLTAFAWGRAGYIGWTLLGSVVALFITRRVVKGLTKATHWISVIFGFLLLSFGSQLKLLDHLGRSSLPKVQLLWILTFLLSLVMLTVLRARRGAAAMKDRIDEKRRRELEYSQVIGRQKRGVNRASGPGTITGYEPYALEGIELTDHPHMHGTPGEGLAGSGFAAENVKRGQEGELNFAKALQTQGHLDSFASFWSVHLADSEIGASLTYNTDIDCVLVTATSVWLVDVKNYAQGDVTWRVEPALQANADGRTELIAIDNATDGYVGRPRPMSRNMLMAHKHFSHRFKESGLPFTVRPVVVMMPRDNGLGVIDNVKWPGDIPTVGLPTLLSWLASERPFQASSEDSQLVAAILDSLLKDESGSALRLGEFRSSWKRKSAPPAVTSVPAATRPPTPSPSTATADEPHEPVTVAKSTGSMTCDSCGATKEENWEFCYKCGA